MAEMFNFWRFPREWPRACLYHAILYLDLPLTCMNLFWKNKIKFPKEK
jgi:hypothetical protein